MSNEYQHNKPLKKRPVRAELSFLLNHQQSPQKRTRHNPIVSTSASNSICRASSSSTTPPNNDIPQPASHEAPPDDPRFINCQLQNFQTGNRTSSQSSRPQRQGNLDRDDLELNEIQASPSTVAVSSPDRSTNTQGITQAERPRITNRVSCSECGTHFCNEQAVQRHKRSMHVRGNPNPGPVKCNHCNLVLKSQQNLVRHTKSHGPGARFECKECEAKFTTQRSRTTHMRDLHGVVSAKRNLSKISVVCPYGCGYSSNQKTNVTRHCNSVHLGIRNFICTACGHRTTTQANLDAHRSKHENNRKRGKKSGKTTEGGDASDRGEDRTMREGSDVAHTESPDKRDREDADN